MDWRSWCRLCGNLSGSIVVDNDVDQIEIVSQVLKLNLSKINICCECANFLADINSFKARTISLQGMFSELSQNSSEPNLTMSDDHLNLIRAHYGLSQRASEVLLNIQDAQEEGLELIAAKEETMTADYLDCCDQDAEYIDGIDSPVYEETTSSCPSPRRKPHQRKNHEKTENEKLYEFKCHICELEFSKMQLLSTHCRSIHQTNPQVLCWCGVVLSTWKRLMAHKSKHIKEDDEFSCAECNISYKTKSAFEKHNLTKHGPDAVRFMCAICGKEFKERQILKNHEKIHLPDELKLKHPCSYCGKKFVNSHCLKIHIARVHEKVALHTCELCGKGCITKSDLKWHMDKHVEERNFECEICHLKFKSTNSLRIHKRRHFNQDKIIVCPICGKEFFSSAALSNHKLVHSDVKRYKCFCGNEYKRLESYKCHLNSTHTGERPFSCMWCNRTFVNSANCRKHKLKDHPLEVAEYEAVHGKKGVSLAKTSQRS